MDFFLLHLILHFQIFSIIVSNDQPFCTPWNIWPREFWYPRGKRDRSFDCRLSRSCRLRYRYQLQTIEHFHTVQLNPSGSSAKDHLTAMAYLTYETSLKKLSK